MKFSGTGQALLILCFMLFVNQARADNQDLTGLTEQVHEYISESLMMATGDTQAEVVVTNLDARLQLKSCPQKPTLSLTHGKILDARLIVTAECPSAQWQLRIPVEIKRYAYALVAQDTIKRGEPIQNDHVTLMKINVSKLNRFYENSKELEGYVAKSTIRAGKVLKPYMFKLPKIVKRGSQVQIMMNMPGLQIQSSGIAMGHGVKNQTIQVKNLSSNKLIEATVVGPNSVRVEL